MSTVRSEQRKELKGLIVGDYAFFRVFSRRRFEGRHGRALAELTIREYVTFDKSFAYFAQGLRYTPTPLT